MIERNDAMEFFRSLASDEPYEASDAEREQRPAKESDLDGDNPLNGADVYMDTTAEEEEAAGFRDGGSADVYTVFFT